MSFSGESPTVREEIRMAEAMRDETNGESTLRERAPGPSWDGLRSFRGMSVLEQLPTRGAEADIYLLQDERDERHILKLYRHRLEPKLEVLERIREISRAHSRHFVVFRDAGFDEATGRWFELQEYLPLGSLKDVPAGRRRDPEFVRNLVSELAGAIHCLHGNNIVHCDIKPGNVLVRSLDPLDLVLTDFGISSILAADVSQKMTGLKGTPMYWAPEAFSRLAGRPGDWWGLGMMVLELLSGEHPFAGLTDSQIIHRLTIGNAEIPDGLSEEWELLLRGLLTKDDSKRWGYGQVARWLAGERDIPVHYEAFFPGTPKTRETRPFRFEGRDYHTPEELARAFCTSEQPWIAASQYLRYVRSWLEGNMQFDEAVELGNDMDRLESEMALFRFVHRYAKSPFVYLGKVIDANNLRLFLARTARREAGFSEQRIARMPGDGSLLPLYDEYAGLTGKNDPLLRRILVFMDGRPPEEQWRCLEALCDPEACLWPKDLEGATRSTEQVIGTLEKFRTPPLKRADLEALQAEYILPECLKAMFESSGTYSAALEWLSDHRERELLIPRHADPHGTAIDRMTLHEYSARARVICMGHTSAFLDRLDRVLKEWQGLPPPLSPQNEKLLERTRECLAGLRTKKVASRDILFLEKFSTLMQQRHDSVRKGRLVGSAVAVGGIALLWLLSPLWEGTVGQSLLAIGVASALILLALTSPRFTSLLQPRDEYGHRRRLEAGDSQATLFFIGALAALFFADRLSSDIPGFFVVLLGVLSGCLAYRLQSTATGVRNLRSVLEACAEYCGENASRV